MKMATMLKKNFLKLFSILFLILLLGAPSCFAFNLNECYKIYSYDADILYMNALSVLNSASKYNIVEMQSKNGYVLFTYGAKYHLLTLTKRYKNQTEIKILPQNSDYNNGCAVAKEVFATLDNRLKAQPMELIK